MAKGLKSYFPVIREREEVLHEIAADAGLKKMFDDWSGERQEQFLNMCTGVKGVKLLYDTFFKEIMNPEYAPWRLGRFLSLVIGEEVTIRQVLPNDSTRIADETSLLIMDIVVEFGDGSLGNMEVQKVGYSFPGERCACYSADLLLRQYKRVRDDRKEKNRKFSYRDIKRVYTVVLFERSSQEFHKVRNSYIHRSGGSFDTGLKIDLLQKYILIPLDIFGEIMHNKPIETELEAWLTFLSTDEPEKIMELIEKYPEFRRLYGDVYEMCRNMERVMGMFSKELQEIDRNTVQYMIDEMQEDLDKKMQELDRKIIELDEKNTELDEKNTELDEKNTELDEKNTELDKKNTELGKKNTELDEKNTEIDKKNTELDEKNTEIDKKNTELDEKNTELDKKNTELNKQKEVIEGQKRMLQEQKEQQAKKLAIQEQKYEEAMKRLRELEKRG